MSANDCSVDHHVFVVGIARQQLENTVENAALCPSAKALVHDPPVAETRRQITPGNSRSISVKKVPRLSCRQASADRGDRVRGGGGRRRRILGRTRHPPVPVSERGLSAAKPVRRNSCLPGRPGGTACGRSCGGSNRRCGGACTTRFPNRGNG